jgi:pimeloyl-ACP methyl ester carboxylesterase
MARSEVEVDGATIEYEDRGTGRPVVCVHGYLMGGDLWDELAERLAARGYRVLTPTWPLGAHRVPLADGADAGVLAQVRRIAGFLAALDLDDVVLVGNDTGGALCQLVAAHHPEPIGALVLTNCDVFERFPPSFFKALRTLARSRRAFGLLPRAVQVGGVRRSPLGYGLLSHAGVDDRAAGWVRPARDDARVREDTRRFTRDLDSSVLLAAEDGMRRFDRPALLVWGTDDRLFPMKDAERLATVFPDARLERVTGSRTYVMVDQPDRLADLITAFAPVTT